ncbi:MAG TPA: hypothetical protein VFC19_47840 [Candidatus Limnocylindrales bacterium]|nr:hypothetical protein [Candidatus Limnocylindrales bacterium]
MPETLTERQAQILGKDRDSVRELLGEPVKVGHWTTADTPQGASPADVEAFQEKTLDEIWIYFAGRVHFNLAGKAAKVDDKTRLDLPPPENFV